MKKSVLGIGLALCALPVCAGEAELESRLPEIFAKSEAQFRVLLKAMESEKPDATPRRFEDGKVVPIPPKDWCSGFFPGSLWYLYEFTRDDFWKRQATAYTERLIEPLRHDANNHDVGFRTYCSAGNALRLTGDARYAAFLHDTAAALRTRYNDKLGLICSWNTDPKKTSYFAPQFAVIIDNMMNLELLEWDAKNGGDPKSDLISRSQADSTDRHHFRPDGSAYHVLGYNRANGTIHAVYAGQGATTEGTWSRGQAWAIYGFTMMYRETRNGRYLARAIRAADYWLDEPKLPADGVPYWDFNASDIPHEERDASAAAVTASALLELSGFAPAGKAAKYRAAGVKILESLASPAYFAAPGANGGFLLMHCVGCKPNRIGGQKGGEVDVPLNYADYYFLEALLRFRALRAAKPAVVRVDARYVPERMDDFCWENEFCGMRAYGPKVSEPAPAGEGLVSSGFDVFNKAVPDVLMADTLVRGVKEKISYHKNNGRGFDNYKVSTGRGCGGIARLDAKGWSYQRNWRAQRILEKSAEKAVFELEYEDFTVRGTVTAGTPFVRFDVMPKKGAAAPGLLGPGLDVSAKRQHDGTLKLDLARGFIANWEPETEGHVMTAIILGPKHAAPHLASDDTGCVYLLQDGEAFTYYAGAAWSGAGAFRTPEAWFAAVREFAAGLK